MSRFRSRFALAIFGAAVLTAMAIGWGTRAWHRSKRLELQVRALQSQLSAALDRHDAPAVRVAAPLAAPKPLTWGELLESVRSATQAVDLPALEYRTGRVVGSDDPLSTIPAEASKPAASSATNEAPSNSSLYRAMTAELRGSGSYSQLVDFTEALAHTDPALTLDQLTISAAPGGARFAARLHLVTSLPIAAAATPLPSAPEIKP